MKDEVLNMGHKLSEEHVASLDRPYNPREIKDALLSIPGDKSPRLDGFGCHFFRDSYVTIGEEVKMIC